MKHMLQQFWQPACHFYEHDKRKISLWHFFSLLGISVPSRQSFDPRKHASIASIRWRRDHFTFTVKSSETDQFGYGQAVCITRSHSIHLLRCAGTSAIVGKIPHQCNTFHIQYQPTGTAVWHICAAFWQQQVINRWHLTHSIRIGAASSAAQAEILTSQIKLLGCCRISRAVKEALKSGASSQAKLAYNYLC